MSIKIIDSFFVSSQDSDPTLVTGTNYSTETVSISTAIIDSIPRTDVVVWSLGELQNGNRYEITLNEGEFEEVYVGQGTRW